MDVTDGLVEHLSGLARLNFDPKEKQEIKKDLVQMIAFVDKLNELDLKGVEPLIHLSENSNMMREDEVKGSITREEGMKNAASHDTRFFKVPKVIKK